MRILVCGGRKFNDYQLVHKTLFDYLDYDLSIIEGGAKGADHLAAMFARHYGVHHMQYKADWARHGKSAGAIRNVLMLKQGEPDLVIAFPGGNGTKHMVDIAKKAGVNVIEVNK